MKEKNRINWEKMESHKFSPDSHESDLGLFKGTKLPLEVLQIFGGEKASLFAVE